MFGWLLILFIVTPLVELWLLMLVGEQLGATPTISLVLITGFVGATLAKRQGLHTWLTIQQQTQQGKLPTDALLDGLMIFIAGLLLITPGILTDVVGFSLLVPLVRAGLRQRLRESFRVHTSVHVQGFGGTFGNQQRPPGSPDDDEVIDVDFERHPEDESPPEHHSAGPSRLDRPKH
ncbi:MAG: FxsA family protein [Planctomycetota bacterium]